jgi:2-dehydro-3-deoxygalactonokinase
VRRGLAGSGLSHAVFGARTRALMGELPAAEVGDWLSGVLLGEEIAAARRWLGGAALRAPVRVIGSDALAQRYRVALTEGGIAAVAGPPDAAALGLYRIAEIAGWCR